MVGNEGWGMPQKLHRMLATIGVSDLLWGVLYLNMNSLRHCSQLHRAFPTEFLGLYRTVNISGDGNTVKILQVVTNKYTWLLSRKLLQGSIEPSSSGSDSLPAPQQTGTDTILRDLAESSRCEGIVEMDRCCIQSCVKLRGCNCSIWKLRRWGSRGRWPNGLLWPEFATFTAHQSKVGSAQLLQLSWQYIAQKVRIESLYCPENRSWVSVWCLRISYRGTHEVSDSDSKSDWVRLVRSVVTGCCFDNLEVISWEHRYFANATVDVVVFSAW